MEQELLHFLAQAREFIFNQNTGYITLMLCFGIFYFDFKKSLIGKIDEVHNSVNEVLVKVITVI